MIDLHTHVLPHFDDGAKDAEIAVAMLREEAAQGVELVVATPHYYGKRMRPAQFLEKSRAALERLQPLCPSGLQLRLGTEVHFTGVNMPDFDELCLLAIEGTRHILLELPFTTVWTSRLIDKVADFIYETGYTPIIAHAERYLEVNKRPSLVAELVKMGCLIQVNASSFLNKAERGLAFALLKRGFVHCIGSDAHNVSDRKPQMEEAKTAIENAKLSEAWERTQAIAQKIIAGEQVRVECGKPVKKFFGKYF